jgi:hypothetical protein
LARWGKMAERNSTMSIFADASSPMGSRDCSCSAYPRASRPYRELRERYVSHRVYSSAGQAGLSGAARFC